MSETNSKNCTHLAMELMSNFGDLLFMINKRAPMLVALKPLLEYCYVFCEVALLDLYGFALPG